MTKRDAPMSKNQADSMPSNARPRARLTIYPVEETNHDAS